MPCRECSDACDWKATGGDYKVNVSLVEDEEDIRRFLRAALRSEHYRPLEAGTIVARASWSRYSKN